MILKSKKVTQDTDILDIFLRNKKVLMSSFI